MSKIIKLNDDTIKKVEEYREHFRETWDDLIKKILEKLNDEKLS